ncbi:gliding motility-associated C-terminal domain-containing protein [Spirosoma montaniterrae]|uniref:Ig-like domain-containing protein n=1 Tax=Spirosoma montaniterrae TaxID=1178516 RepID=A0A1P9WUG6_9BACT|nr:gliding motility-associated C-terminal domain-containing protein [Spirosoma montaniterrae]AQG78980.1 hypothetical protein AWR27_06345 [Spirosoma montaniterrae]
MGLNRLLFCSWFLILSASAWATHHVGGEIEMRAIGNTPGQFRIIVTNYLEAGFRADQQAGGVLGIFRKRDNTLMMSFSVSETGQRKALVFANETCAAQRNLRFIAATFAADIQLDPARYDDPGGYYISYQTRNRNGGINNIVNAVQTGYTFYLEFPALLQNGQYVANSSPRFAPINGEYICVGEPFVFPFGGTDPDGDELRYSMATPLNQKNDRNQQVSPAPYPDVIWASGFGADNAIPGSPALRVDPQTGQLSVTANQLGLFVFAVNVAEYRNGVKIGEVRRDFQFLVIDCPPVTTPDAVVRIRNQPPAQRDVTICRGDSSVLIANANANWNYQWRRDGINLSGATQPTLAVRESGEYTVVVSTKNTCSKVGNSEVLKITVVGSGAKLSVSGHLCATTGAISLTANTADPVTYRWERNNQRLPGQTADTLRTTEPGRYWAVLTHTTLGCLFRTDTANLERSPAVQAVIQSGSGQSRLCPNGTLPLTASGGTRYAWQFNGQAVSATNPLSISTAGSYVVTATDLFGCEGVSAPFVVTQLPTPNVRFDSLPGVCGPDAPAYALVGSPPGGAFAGPGVDEAGFSPKQAGVGNHTLTYTVKAAPECTGTVATRTAIVAPIPTITLPDSMVTYRGNTFTMDPAYTGNPNGFTWSGSTFLDDPSAANPTVLSIRNDIQYVVSVKNATGCEARDTIHITVLEQVWIPDAFSPNNDGMNDVWTIPGIRAFPDAIVTVFNRWGEVIFRSERGYPTPFDGLFRGEQMPPGLYPYTLYTVPDRPVIRGYVVLTR